MSKRTKKKITCLVCGTFENCYDPIEGNLKVKDKSLYEDLQKGEVREVSMKDVEFVPNEEQEEKRPEFKPVDMEMPDDSTLMGFVCSDDCEDTFNRNPMKYAESMVVLFPPDDDDFVMIGGN